MGKVAFMFPGQGSQTLGMAQDLCSSRSNCRAIIDIASEVTSRDVAGILFGDDAEALNQTVNTQVCLLAAELCILAAVKDSGLMADALVGFSLGEWAALVAADVIDAKTAFAVVDARARAMQDAIPLGKGGMAAVLGQSDQDVEGICASIGGIWPSNYNCEGQVTVAGSTDALEAMRSRCENEEIPFVPLAVSVPSHCPLMEPAARAMEEILASVPFGEAKTPVVMNATATVETAAETIKNNMVLQITHPVRFTESLAVLLEDEFDTFVEIGPGKVLSKLVKKTCREALILRVSNEASLAEAVRAFETRSV